VSFVIINNRLRQQQTDLNHWRHEVGKLHSQLDRMRDERRQLNEYRKRKGARMKPVSWTLHKQTEDIIFIVDDDNGGMSITNAAEAVVKDAYEAYGDRRIVYRDTMGEWDELVHDHGRFTGFDRYKAEIPA